MICKRTGIPILQCKVYRYVVSKKIKSSTSRRFDIAGGIFIIYNAVHADGSLGNTSSGAGMADLCWQDRIPIFAFMSGRRLFSYP